MHTFNKILNSYIFFIWSFPIFYNQYDLTNALIGKNVRIAKEQEFLSVVSIGKVNNDTNSLLEINHFCTGVLITNRDVLTAAHCLQGKDINDIRIIIGAVDLRNGRILNLTQWISYEKWTKHKNIIIKNSPNDISIIRLYRNVSDELKPSPISTLQSTELYGLNVVISAYGSSDTSHPALIMETSIVRILSNPICEYKVMKIHGKRVPFHKRFLCTAAFPSVLLTWGDSGGPLFYNNTVVGVNIGTCLYQGQSNHPGKLNLHSGTDYYRYFIEDFVNNF